MRGEKFKVCGLLFIAWLGLASLGHAQNCLRHDCSDDVAGVEIWGNEFITHDAAPLWATRDAPVTPENRRCYEYAAWDILLNAYTHLQQNYEWSFYDEDEGIVKYVPPRPGFNPYAVPNWHPVEYIRYTFAMRSCIGHGTPAEMCGSWQPFVTPGDPESGQDYIEIIGGVYQCFGSDSQGRCIKRCYPSGSMPLYGLISECEN